MQLSNNSIIWINNYYHNLLISLMFHFKQFTDNTLIFTFFLHSLSIPLLILNKYTTPYTKASQYHLLKEPLTPELYITLIIVDTILVIPTIILIISMHKIYCYRILFLHLI